MRSTEPHLDHGHGHGHGEQWETVETAEKHAGRERGVCLGSGVVVGFHMWWWWFFLSGHVFVVVLTVCRRVLRLGLRSGLMLAESVHVHFHLLTVSAAKSQSSLSANRPTGYLPTTASTPSQSQFAPPVRLVRICSSTVSVFPASGSC